MGADFDLAAALKEVAQDLVAGGVRSASTNPHKVNTPGVWVTCTGFEKTTLAGGYLIDLALVLLADPDAGHQRTVEALSKLYRDVANVVPITGRVTPSLVPLDVEDAPLPALSVPTQVRWTP